MAYTAVVIGSKATTGMLPISLALSVVLTDTHVLVKDDAELYAPEGDINLAASCTMTVDTIAKTSEPT